MNTILDYTQPREACIYMNILVHGTYMDAHALGQLSTQNRLGYRLSTSYYRTDLHLGPHSMKINTPMSSHKAKVTSYNIFTSLLFTWKDVDLHITVFST